ncbi:MAG: hypothetical protein IIX96_00320, partial [Clostridia bacterium]|nr:hypothetical protein [Clostridia bacterium]
SRDSSDSFYSQEHKYISTAYPKFVSAVEKMMVACARSENAERFEEEYFGEGLIEKYRDGATYTDEVVALMEREAELEVSYQSFSTNEVVITVYGETNTAQYFYDYYAEKHKNNESKLNAMNILITTAYNGAVRKLSKPILVDLIKIRRLIADELNYASYAELAYSTLYHDYTTDEAMALFDSVAEDVVEVYAKLSSTVFYSYSPPSDVKGIHENTLINKLYSTYYEADSDLYEIFCYMLQHGLYDVKNGADLPNRFDGAFSVYLKDNSSPFIFVSTKGYLSDISTLAHEFGHFSDFYINSGATTSLDLSEVSSQALELLTTNALKGELSAAHYEYIKYTQLENIMMSIISQSFYAYFEHLAYALPYAEISESRLDECVLEAAEKFSLNTSSINSIDAVMISHIFLYPFYVQSYVTSALSSLEIYFKETETKGAGFEAYKTLVSREAGLTFVEHLNTAGLTSPFESGFARDIADKIYYHIVGAHYYKQSPDEIA